MRRNNTPLLLAAKWMGTAAGIVGAVLVAANVGVVGWGFIAWAISSSLWTYAGWAMREPSLILLQAVFLIIDLVGIWRWFFV
ncbi:conserved exported hypothetical protein [Rhodospirillaceae bacterium LM-1]|nr:conserved exported hypothetical protein [Rhodospirillaceae bacterium LM-1]